MARVLLRVSRQESSPAHLYSFLWPSIAKKHTSSPVAVSLKIGLLSIIFGKCILNIASSAEDECGICGLSTYHTSRQ